MDLTNERNWYWQASQQWLAQHSPIPSVSAWQTNAVEVANEGGWPDVELRNASNGNNRYIVKGNRQVSCRIFIWRADRRLVASRQSDAGARN